MIEESASLAAVIASLAIRAVGKVPVVVFAASRSGTSDAAMFAVSNNAKLTSITPSSLDEVGHITISNNALLASFNLSSLQTIPIAGTYNINISGNGKLTGNYFEATAASTTTAYVEARIVSDDLNSLKPYITLAANTSAVTYVFASLNLPDVDGQEATTTTLLADIAADTAGTAAYVADTAGVSTTFTEKDFVRLVEGY